MNEPVSIHAPASWVGRDGCACACHTEHDDPAELCEHCIRDKDRVPMTTEEKVELADWLYECRVIEKFRDHWEWQSQGIGCTGPTLVSICDMVTDTSDDQW